MEIIGAPFDLCGHTLGSRLGPAAVRLAGITETLTGRGLNVVDSGDISVDLSSQKGDGLKYFNQAQAAYRELFKRTEAALQAGRMPLMIGGDHSLSIGSIGAALKHYEGDLAVLWIDAHVDINTPDTSPSGNLHGMPLACLMNLPTSEQGLQGEQWKALTDEFGQYPLRPERTAWFGLRDVDEGEAARLRAIPHEYTATMSDIDRKGLLSEMERFNQWLSNSNAKNLWISFDVDSLDPFLAPGTGTAVRGGLTYREMHLLAETLYIFLKAGNYRLVGLDVVEVNPILDNSNVTAKTAVEWLASLFGKTIL